MMTTLLVLKSKVKNFYEKNYHIVRGILKAGLMFGALLIVTGQLDYNEFLGQYWLLALIALLCGVMPDLVSVGIVLLVTCAEISSVSVLLAFTVLTVLVIYLLLFGRMEMKQCYLLVSIPLLSAVHIGYVVPIVAALFASPVMLPAMIMGILLQFMMQGVNAYAAAAMGTEETENVLSSLQYLFEYLLQNRLMMVTILAFCLTFVCVYLIRRGRFKHGYPIAVLVGTIILMSVELLSNIVLDLDLNLVLLTIQVVISMVIAYVIQFFHMTLDYHGTRKLQFEDDEYYYFVTAVPKFKVAVVDKTVTRIIPDDEGEVFDLKEELEKALEEEEAEAKSD